MVRAPTITPQPIDRKFLSGAPKPQADALHRHLDTVRASREQQPLGTIAVTASIGSPSHERTNRWCHPLENQNAAAAASAPWEAPISAPVRRAEQPPRPPGPV